MRRTSFSSVCGFANSPRSARVSKWSSGMLLHRKNDKREASSRSLSGYGAGSRLGGIAVDAQQEIRIHQHPLQRELDAGVEIASRPAPLSKNCQQRVGVAVL